MEQEILNQAPAGLQVTEIARLDLLSAAKWAKFLCIVGCVCVCLMLLFGILMMVFGATLTQYMGDSPLGGAMGLLYVIFAAIYIYPLIKGFQFANGAKAACLTDSEAQLARSFSGLRAMIKFFGVLTIIVMVLYVLAIIGIVIFGFAMTK